MKVKLDFHTITGVCKLLEVGGGEDSLYLFIHILFVDVDPRRPLDSPMFVSPVETIYKDEPCT